MNKIYFDHEKLNVYQDSLKFAAWSEAILERVSPKAAIYGQLDRARTSIPLNIAEGNGKFTAPDRCTFFDTAWGSSLECASCLDLLLIKKLLAEDELDVGKETLRGIVSMLVGLIRSHDPSRLKEEPVSYRVGQEE
jgi:four helix bundle protein